MSESIAAVAVGGAMLVAVAADLAPMSARDPVRSRGSGVPRRLALSSALVLTAILGACGSDNHPVIVIENRLSFPVAVVFLNSAGQESSLVETISPGLEYSVDVFPTDRCTPGVMIARDTATGAEVGRSQSPVCRPSRWIIAAPAVSP